MLKHVLCFSTYMFFCFGCGPLMKAKYKDCMEMDDHWLNFFSMPSLHQSSKETTTVNLTWIDTRTASMLGCLEVYLSLEETMNTWPDLCYGGFCGRLASDGYNKGMMTHRGRNPQGPKIMYSNQGGWLKKKIWICRYCTN